MATTKKRLNISLSPTLEEALEEISRRDKVPQASKAAELLKIALEIEEDTIWDKLASERDIQNKNFISHKQAWK